MGGGNTLSTVAARAKDAATFDISVKAEGDAALTRDQARAILQAVLAERFKLRVHRETRDLSVYALVVGKSGPKLKEGARDEPSKASFDMGASARMVNRKAQISRLADFLSLQADRPVLDRTGLAGFYDFTLEWRFNPGQQSALGLPEDPDPAAPSLLTAVQEQLGLRLEAANAPVQVLVIDHVEPPSEN